MTEAELLEAMHTGVWTAALDDEDYTYAAPPPVAVSAAELAQLRADLAASLAQLAAVPVEALRWIDHARTSGTWSSIEGPPAYAALHSWLAQQGGVQP